MAVGHRHPRGGPQQCEAVGPAPGGGEHEGASDRLGAAVEAASAVGQVAGEPDPPGQGVGHLAVGDRVVDGGIAVDPHLVEKGVQLRRVAEGAPLGGGDGGIVEHLAQPEHDPHAGALGAQPVQRTAQLPLHPVDVTVDDHQVGGVGEQGRLDEGRAESDEPARGTGEPAGLVAGGALGDAGDGQPVEAGGQDAVVPHGQPGDEEPREGTAGGPRDGPGEGVGERQVAAHVAQPLGVVAAEEHSDGRVVHGDVPIGSRHRTPTVMRSGLGAHGAAPECGVRFQEWAGPAPSARPGTGQPVPDRRRPPERAGCCRARSRLLPSAPDRCRRPPSVAG